MEERWVDNQGVAVHYLMNGDFGTTKVPLLILPGLCESADEYKWMLEKLSPHPCVVLSYRGRGKSARPKYGYTLYDHIQDMEAVTKDAGLQAIAMYGFSRGVSYMLGYALSNKSAIKGMIIGDYPALHKTLSRKWLSQYSYIPFPGSGKEKAKLSYKVAKALQNDSHDVVFWEALSGFQFPVLVIKGEGSQSFISKQDMRKYEWYLPIFQPMILNGYGHNINEDKRICDIIKKYLLMIER
ncbi:alpha/beta fold hydrolase [Sediminibacillus massiliensis]|uniref:alpha/beta fold hydrolase n=1 Tax=Sediminibacillus massiliensis TaxID=1926277 RepID=UPI0009886715|nr:alpha/beta hydrolase [Sediminibacillus massiliensis]